MIRRITVLLLLFSIRFTGFAQGVSHFIYVQAAAAQNKQMFLADYSFGYRRICFNLAGGTAKGTDDQFIAPENRNDDKAKEKIRASQTVEPQTFPSNSYLESCNSTYSGNQIRFGFTLFLRRDDTLGRHPFTGVHVGVDAAYMYTYESQSVTYKSQLDDTRNTFSGKHSYSEIGAVTHLGWQFALINEHLYIDVRAVIPFYYPFMANPNLNSPFTGTKYEAEICVGWHFKAKEAKPKDDPKGVIRHQL